MCRQARVSATAGEARASRRIHVQRSGAQAGRFVHMDRGVGRTAHGGRRSARCAVRWAPGQTERHEERFHCHGLARAAHALASIRALVTHCWRRRQGGPGSAGIPGTDRQREPRLGRLIENFLTISCMERGRQSFNVTTPPARGCALRRDAVSAKFADAGCRLSLVLADGSALCAPTRRSGAGARESAGQCLQVFADREGCGIGSVLRRWYSGVPSFGQGMGCRGARSSGYSIASTGPTGVLSGKPAAAGWTEHREVYRGRARGSIEVASRPGEGSRSRSASRARRVRRSGEAWHGECSHCRRRSTLLRVLKDNFGSRVSGEHGCRWGGRTRGRRQRQTRSGCSGHHVAKVNGYEVCRAIREPG